VFPADQAGPASGRQPVGRRAFLRLAGAAAAGGALAACSSGSSGGGVRPIRLGYVSPQSGPFVSFGEADGFVLDDVRARLRDGLTIGRRSYPVEILVKDSQSDPGRAATVAGDLLRRERIDLMLTSSTPGTTNPVADVCERAGVPCISKALDDLFHLDHLATRMRRYAENLIVLSGAEPPRRWVEPIPLGDVVRGASAEVEGYTRVVVRRIQGLGVSGQAASDVIHLLAELLENTAAFSPRRRS
jgi:hypothetical protein